MTKDEAISQMKAGNKLTHRWFGDEEWIKSDRAGMILILEDGVECSPNEFWKWRTDPAWETGWEIFKK